LAGSAGAGAGLAVGDVITAVGARPVRRAADLSSAFYLRRVGEPFAVTVVREGRLRTLTLSLGP
jgi:S1-C subfamily serine protease